MDREVRAALTDAWHGLNAELGDGGVGWPSPQPAEDAQRVFYALKGAPWAPAREVAMTLGLDRDRMLLAGKCIQRAQGLAGLFRQGAHSDYFNVVRHYFDARLYTLVFFVGASCPSRCVFCPNVTVHANGSRCLTDYGHRMAPMDKATIGTVFQALGRMKRTGSGVLVKISGGLEPLTDLETLSLIARQARALGVPVKLFTNGILLNTAPRRRAALMAGDIRISLSTADADQYEFINFGKRRARGRMRLDHLRDNLRALVRERDRTGSGTQIGFNSIIMPENCDQVLPLMALARDLGIDYIDFKPDYFGTVSEAEQARILDTVGRAIAIAGTGRGKGPYLHFAGAIERNHLYWQPWDGVCDAAKQGTYKMFVTPFGHLSPIHYGAFPHGDRDPEEALSLWAVGRLNDATPFLDVLACPAPIPEVPWSRLNPFELMLALEIEREADDSAWGIPLSCSPYHTSRRQEVSEELIQAWKRRGAHAL